MKRWTVISVIAATIGLYSSLLNGCSKRDKITKQTPFTFSVPEGFPQPVYDFAANPMTKQGVELGQKLFYDGRLSKDGYFPCASCHQQDAAFTTFEHDLSHGYNNSHTTRNAPALANLAWQSSFRLDGSVLKIDEQSLSHITSPTEMAESMGSVIEKLKGDSRYRGMFYAAYGDEQINSDRLLNALTQFCMSMISANSKYDQVKKGQATFSVYEEMGYEVFKAKCNSCHKEPLFTDYSFRNIGLPVHPQIKDLGMMKVTGNKADSLKFRVPSLRNVSLSSYYMHDGRFSSLLKSIEHYRSGIQQSSSLDPSLFSGISLNDTEVTNLIAFLKTLSDSSYIRDSRYAKPSF